MRWQITSSWYLHEFKITDLNFSLWIKGKQCPSLFIHWFTIVCMPALFEWTARGSKIHRKVSKQFLQGQTLNPFHRWWNLNNEGEIGRGLLKGIDQDAEKASLHSLFKSVFQLLWIPHRLEMHILINPLTPSSKV
jgi:hypothetical protein